MSCMTCRRLRLRSASRLRENRAISVLPTRMRLETRHTNTKYLAIPSPKSVTLKGLREVRKVVVYHNDNSKPAGSPHGHFSTFAMSPSRCVQNNAASIQPYCVGAAGHDGTRNH